jgi:hypothetical protein
MNETPTPAHKTLAFWLTIAALFVTGMLSQKLFPSDSIGEKLLFVLNFVLGGLGYTASRSDVKKAWNIPSPEQQGGK